uniref:Importin-5 n=1 Tax=Cajanus cajan TaxID=3821 RepID=A0A151U9K4_CAJCA|nr:Importin-5 [Cajanus cajan]
METLFSHLYSPQHQHRSQALAFLQCCKRHHPDLLFIKLFFLLRCTPLPETRANAARALLLLNPADFWPNLKPIAQARLKAHFLTFLALEPSIHVLRLASLLLAETLAATYKSHQTWPEMLDFLLSSLASNDDKLREVAALVLAKLPNDSRFLVSNAFREKRSALRPLHAAFLAALASSNPDVQVASFAAVVGHIRLFSDPALFHELLRAVMVGVFALLHVFEATYFRSAFAELVNLVYREPLLLKPYMNDMVLDVLQIAESGGLSKETHRLAFELVVAMTEVKEYEHVFVNLPNSTARRLLCVPMKMLLCVGENGSGGGGGDSVSEGEKVVDVYGFGMKWLKKLCVALGANKAVPAAYEVLRLHLDNAQWNMRHAGITMLSILAEEFSDELVLMDNFLGEVVTKVLKSIQDSHIQVRLATFKFMETPTNFVQAVHILYHHKLVHAFCMALDNDQDHKVKEQAVSAMLFFLKNTLPESLTLNKNGDILMSKLLPLLQGKESAKQRSIALSILNIVAQRCHEVAHKYCATFLPILLEACNDENSEINEEAARGIRIFAELGTPQLKPFVNRILLELGVLMNHPNRSLSENAKAHDIAVSALGRICEVHRECIDGSKIVPAWLSFLPLENDLIEAKVMHEQLCLMVSRLDKDLLGSGNQNLVKIIVVFLEVSYPHVNTNLSDFIFSLLSANFEMFAHLSIFGPSLTFNPQFCFLI